MPNIILEQFFVHLKLKLLYFLSDFVLSIFEISITCYKKNIPNLKIVN